MCVDTLLLKFSNDEKQFTRLFISVFASDRILSPTNGGRPPVVVGGPCNALRAGIEMTINLPGHLMSVTRRYFTNNCSFIWVAVCSFELFSCNLFILILFFY